MKIEQMLKQANLRDTQSRRLVLQILSDADTPLTHKQIYTLVRNQNAAINLTTVYRMLQTFVDLGIAHPHGATGGYVLCKHPDSSGHHVVISCNNCGVTAECTDAMLCKQEQKIASSAGFTVHRHLSEIIGLCSTCSS